MGFYDAYWNILLFNLNPFSILLLCCAVLSIKNIILVFMKSTMYVILSVVLLFCIVLFLRLFIEVTIDDHGDALSEMTRHLSWETSQRMYSDMLDFERNMMLLWYVIPYMGIGLLIQSLLLKRTGQVLNCILVTISFLLLLFVNLLPAIFAINWQVPFLRTVPIADLLLICLILLSLLSKRSIKLSSCSSVTKDH